MKAKHKTGKDYRLRINKKLHAKLRRLSAMRDGLPMVRCVDAAIDRELDRVLDMEGKR